MGGFFHTLGTLFRRQDAPAQDGGVPDAETERLRALYRERCSRFRLLLSANKSALEIMADMEEALRGVRPFGMTYVRGACTRACASVFQIVRHLNALSDDRWPELETKFDEIRAGIEAVVAPHVRADGGPLVLPIAETGVDMADQTGGKMANLGEIRRRLGITVPDGFVVTATGYQCFMEAGGLQEEIDRRVQAADATRLDEVFALSASIQQLILSAPVPDELADAITAQVERPAGPPPHDAPTAPHPGTGACTGAEVRFAVRSSAVGEDSLDASFAGQYRSELNVPPEDVLDTFKDIVASKYGVTAMTYRLARGIPDEDVPMCVGCLVMVDAVAGGVAYSRNPLNLRDNTVVINAVPGLPKAVVDGSFSPDVFVVSREVPMAVAQRQIAAKPQRFVRDPIEGVRLEDMPSDMVDAPCIDDARALEIAALAAGFEVFYGEPQDIEWAVCPEGELTILQSRPLREARHDELPEGECAPVGGADGADAAGGDVVAAAESGPLPGGYGCADSGPPVLLLGGTPVSPGAGAGLAHVVRKDMDLLSFPDGGVLVIERALPRWAPLLSRASAVVAEAGGAAGHLASVAREYGVPALFGLPRAAELLEHAGIVTVDADNRRVHPGRIEDILGHAPRRNLMEGSPVHTALSEAARLVLPLNLLDPESPQFAPAHCRTLHDITRFCHEKSVEVLFGVSDHMGATGPGTQRLGKQLRVNGTKLQYWLLDIDGGFRKPVPGPVVDLADIASAPMLALWDGMTAVPWAGPPATDARGFLSVMMESTVNPDLEPTAATTLANRNFLMISRDYCNLQARFGYHFCTVEAMAADNPHENYVTFQFKGGAASADRRTLRARFVGEVLEARGFRADVKDDALFASLEGLPKERILTLVRGVGYLLIHTRQIDMVAHNERVFGPIRDRIAADLARIAPVAG
ncbi:PEP/pyruvate-binding domain-containing protein [Nitratidesulfovibrio liaohensis]|uniref:Phosphoenolpyruvate synthase n=1 Tax=Nitratidesulfovibrio liaohensis TaxID=2604158 RepID=A0ABY9R086_9BACT|nr:PEP/pyruvate-binding domain-containing protein [Nitratidesulfovibrio liaohensis]WMW64228.1 phosphoenolpyruvate synthase [Nitratidesulfovibrio liaohensis]